MNKKALEQYLNGKRVTNAFNNLKTKTGKPAAKATIAKALKAFQDEKRAFAASLG